MTDLLLINDEFDDVEGYSESTVATSLTGGLRVFQVNFRSIRDLRRFDLFVDFLSKFPDSFDVIIVSES